MFRYINKNDDTVRQKKAATSKLLTRERYCRKRFRFQFTNKVFHKMAV